MTAAERQRRHRGTDDPSRTKAEVPYEMVNLVPRMTGLPMTIWASPRGQARHDLRIKVNPTHGRQMVIRDAVTVAVRPAPRVVGGTLSPADRQAILQWIAINEEALVDYWEFQIDTDEFLQRLTPLSPPIPP
jgi:hypothetical protein